MTPDELTDIALIGAGVFGVAALYATFIGNSAIARVVYWVTAYCAVTCLALSVTQEGWAVVAGATVAGIAVTLGYAFFSTEFIKIGGRVYTAEPDSTSETASYDGRISTAAAWWILASGSCLLAVGLMVTRWMPEMFFFVALGALLCGVYGHIDGARGFPYARGHIVAFRILAVTSIAAAGIPVLCYLGAYRIGSQRPGYGKHDAVRLRREARGDS